MLREFVSSAILGEVKQAVAAPNVDLRASLVASQVVGLAFARFVVKLEPIASATLNELVAAIEGASNHLINVEDLSEEEVGVLHQHYQTLAQLVKHDHKLSTEAFRAVKKVTRFSTSPKAALCLINPISLAASAPWRP